MSLGLRLRTQGLILIAATFMAAIAASWVWFHSVRAWQDHLTGAYVAGVSLYEAIRTATPVPGHIEVSVLSASQAALASGGDFTHLDRIPVPAFVTHVVIPSPSRDPLSGGVMIVGIVSDTLPYAVSELVSAEGQSVAQKFGTVTRLLATYCSHPILFARLGEGDWLRIDGTDIWGCDAAPRDMRLLAVLGAGVALAVLATLVLDTSAHFDRFAQALRVRRRVGGPDSYVVQGPAELRDIVSAVNSHLEAERAQLLNRAQVLSGISHDLGTPATRLRLRSALIEDDALRHKLEDDIDSMTDMIDSVLTYTRAEMSAEAPRVLSLVSLIEALVADYQDTGQPVELCLPPPPTVEGAHSIFALASGHGLVPDAQKILITARPTMLKRAVSNLIENALKYGRRASVGLSATADRAIITVEDEGSAIPAAAIEDMIAPFKRGQNTQTTRGFGLGLTIVATVAEQHSGRLSFEDGPSGLRACLDIARE